MAIVYSSFLEYGTKPKSSNFKGEVNTESVFGQKGLKNYLKRNDAIKKSGDKKEDYSFFDYTQRSKAILNSEEKTIYHTISNIGFLTEENEKEWLDIARKSFSRKGNILFQEVLSFKNIEEAHFYGLKTQSDYAVFLNKTIPKIAKELGLNQPNLIWWGDYHSNTKHPHVHFQLLEREQTITKGKIAKNKLDRIKRVLYTELYDRSIDFTKKSSLEYKKEIDKQKKTIVDSISIKNKKLNYATVNRIFNLYVQLDNKGRLQFNSIHQKERREELLEIAEMVIQDVVKKEDLAAFKTLLEDNDKALNTVSPENVFKNAILNYYDLKVRVANLILRSYKQTEFKDQVGLIQPNYSMVATSNEEKSNPDLIKQKIMEKNFDLKEELELIQPKYLEKELKDDFIVKKVKRRRKKFEKENNVSLPKGKGYVLNKTEYRNFSHSLQRILVPRIRIPIQEYFSQIKSEIGAYLRNSKEYMDADEFDISKYVEDDLCITGHGIPKLG